jgi:hypothetical protein
MPTLPDKNKKPVSTHHPNNFSDYAMVYGGQISGVIAMVLTWDEGLLQAFVAGCQGMIMGTFLMALGLFLIGHSPAVFKRIWNGEPLDL